MKKKFTFLMAALALLTLINLPGKAVGQTYEWVETAFSDLTTDDVFVIVGTKDNTNFYSMSAASGSSNPAAASVTISGGKITSEVNEETIIWKLGTATDGYYLHPLGNKNSALYNKKSSGKWSTGLAIGTKYSAGNVFVCTTYSSTTVLQVVESSRYVSIYSTDWRAYADNSNLTATTFYKKQEASSDPSVTISGSDIVNNEAGFTYDNTSTHTATVTCENFDSAPTPTIGVYTDAACNTAYSGDDFTAAFAPNSTTTVNYGFANANPSTSEARTFYMRAAVDDVKSNIITVTQAVAPVLYTVTFNLNGGSFTANADFASASVSKPAGTYHMPSATKAGTNFAGWKIDSGSNVYAYNDEYTVGGDVSFTAQWSNSVTATYTVTSISSVTASGSIPAGSSATYSQTYGTACQMTAGNSVTLTLNGYTGQVIKSLTLSMHSNASSGAGYMSAVAGTTTIASVGNSSSPVTFNSWPGMSAYTNSYTDITIPMSNTTYCIKSGESVVITINATTKSLYCQSFTIEYEASSNPQVFVAPTSRQVDFNAHNSASESLNFTVSSENIDTPTYQFTYCDAEGAVLNPNPYSSWFSATLSGSTVSFTTTQNSGNDRTAYFKVYAEVNSEPVYSGLCSVTQRHEIHTYTLVTSTGQLVPGLHYILAGSKTAGAAQAMGAQNGNYRDVVDVTVTETNSEFTIEEVDGIREFVLSGNGDNNSWTLYDKEQPGFLYASSKSSNYIGTRNDNNDKDSQWSISFNASNEAIIIAQGTNTNNTIRYNSNNTRFSCYGATTSLSDYLYLYVLVKDKNYEFYSNTTLASPTIAANESYTINKTENYSAVLSITGTLTVNGTLTNNGTADNLVIEDGGQLICSNKVNATVHKEITGYGNDTNVTSGWYTIASPVAGANVDVATIGANYDLFAYRESDHTWRNVKDGSNNITTFDEAQGFLYANGEYQELAFAGEMIASTATVTKELSWVSSEPNLKGFNLVGNPFTCNVTSGMVTINGSALTTYYVAEGGSNLITRVLANTPIKPGQGFFVQASAAGNLVFNPGKGKMDYKPTFISIEAGNSEYTDRAYVQLGYGNTLRKMSINDKTPLVYVMNNGKDYASATVDELKGSIPVCFKAAATGLYTISVETEGLDMGYLHLIDRITGDDVDLLLEPTYSFIAVQDDNESRFILSFTANCFNDSESETFAYQAGNDIFVNGEGELQIFDVTGRMVSTAIVNGVETVSVPSHGVYIFRLVGTEVKTQKIVVR